MNKGTKYGLFLIFLMILATTGLFQLGIIELNPLHTAVARITVVDSTTESPIANALVQFDLVQLPFEPKGDVDASEFTNINGKIDTRIATGDYYIKITKPGYEALETPLVPFKEAYVYYTFKLTLSGTTPIGHILTFYVRDGANNPHKWVKAYFEGDQYVANDDGVIMIFGVTSGSKSIRFVDHNSPKSFDWTVTFTMPDNDAKFGMNIDSGVLTTGKPAPPPPPPPSPIDTLWIIIIASVGIIACAILFWGRGPELLGLRGRG